MQSLFVWPNRLVVPMNGQNPAVKEVLQKLQPRIKGLLAITVSRATLLLAPCAPPHTAAGPPRPDTRLARSHIAALIAAQCNTAALRYTPSQFMCQYPPMRTHHMLRFFWKHPPEQRSMSPGRRACDVPGKLLRSLGASPSCHTICAGVRCTELTALTRRCRAGAKPVVGFSVDGVHWYKTAAAEDAVNPAWHAKDPGTDDPDGDELGGHHFLLPLKELDLGLQACLPFLNCHAATCICPNISI